MLPNAVHTPRACLASCATHAVPYHACYSCACIQARSKQGVALKQTSCHWFVCLIVWNAIALTPQLQVSLLSAAPGKDTVQLPSHLVKQLMGKHAVEIRPQYWRFKASSVYNKKALLCHHDTCYAVADVVGAAFCTKANA